MSEQLPLHQGLESVFVVVDCRLSALLPPPALYMINNSLETEVGTHTHQYHIQLKINTAPRDHKIVRQITKRRILPTYRGQKALKLFWPASTQKQIDANLHQDQRGSADTHTYTHLLTCALIRLRLQHAGLGTVTDFS